MKRHPRLVRLGIVLGALVLIVALFLLAILPWSERWGATTEELTSALPGDELVGGNVNQSTHAITIHASPEKVWPWLLQLGVDRGGMYSYDWLENLFGLKVNSADTINPEWQTVETGYFIRLTPKEYFIKPGPGAYILTMELNRTLITCFGMESEFPDPCTNSWQFILTPTAGNSTRLVIRTAVAGEGISGVGGRVFNFISFIMEQKMMRGIKERAENMAP